MGGLTRVPCTFLGHIPRSKIIIMGAGGQQQKTDGDDKVPVTLLCGFLGSGKTTLLKHILETKHSEEDFKCAVIVNDMAELNIDKSLIDQTSLIQSDESMIGMQNGCICCTLQSDLVDQIVKLTQTQKFNYILIEASGVSEPHEIAPLFEVEEHDHEGGEELDHDHSVPQLGEVARLDTCVTLIDSADFYNNLGSMKIYDQCEMVGTIAELMMDQVEFANIIILNKGDLVSEEQQADLLEKVTLLNPKAKIVKTVQSKINVSEILNTRLYKDEEEFWVTSTKNAEAIANEEKKTGRKAPEACTARFDISSFVYRARKPFHPGRLEELVLVPFFMDPWQTLDEDEDENKRTEEEKKQHEQEKKIEMEKVQKEALVKQTKRKEIMGELLRSKGFVWIATSNDVLGCWQQAGNVLRIESEGPWMCLVQEFWRGTNSEPLVLADMTKPDGEEYQFQDRRQEIVFIGHGTNRQAIQEILDKCLLTDEEMALGPEKWKETMEDLDHIKLELRDEDADYDELEAREKEKEKIEEVCPTKDCKDEKCDK